MKFTLEKKYASPICGTEEGKGTSSPPRVAFWRTSHRWKAQTGEAVNCAQRKKSGVERLEMKKDLIAGKLVQINETMRALTYLMDVSG